MFSTLQTNQLLDLRLKIADPHMLWSVCVGGGGGGGGREYEIFVYETSIG